MCKPMIGVLPLVDTEKESFWMLPGYFDGITAAGGVPVMLPLTAGEGALRQLTAACDGFLFTGGQDVSPTVYGAEKSPLCGETNPLRDAMETTMIKLILEADKPLLGICRGIQILNVTLGGTLYQHLPVEYPSTTEHHQTPPYDKPIHSVKITPNSPLEKLTGKHSLYVNSYHHQAIQTLAPTLKAMAYSDDGLTEAVYLPSARFVWAVQWHPEFNYKTDDSSMSIFKAFVDSCKKTD